MHMARVLCPIIFDVITMLSAEFLLQYGATYTLTQDLELHLSYY
jgi:hypothetical protein